MQPIRILIAEDHALFAHGLRRVLATEPDFEVVAEVRDGKAAIVEAVKGRPDVVLMDVNLPGVNGIQATVDIKAARPSTAVLILTAYDEVEQMFYAVRAGASGYFCKDVQPEQLIEAIRLVHQGKYVLAGKVMGQAELMQWLMAWYKSQTPHLMSDDAGSLMPLSPREMEILVYLVRGASNKVIAASLGISQQTVKNHMSSIFRKLAVHDRTEAAVVALRRGWIPLQEARATSAEMT